MSIPLPPMAPHKTPTSSLCPCSPDCCRSTNDDRFGQANGSEMSVGFHELIAHAAATRDLCAGTIIGSGTVSNDTFREVGSSCISERRSIEMIDSGEPVTPFMSFGDSIYMESKDSNGGVLFGTIDQRVVQVSPTVA